jgi:N-acetyl-gamma-glutamyl-phosphate/LysW-gamma-L-alpha-aminoadipyl-6-phosphate reductase
MPATDRKRVVVIGGTGYGGAEVLRLCLRHPGVEVVRVTAADHVGQALGDVHLSLAGAGGALRFEDAREWPAERAAADADVVFLGLPHRVSATVTPSLFPLQESRGLRIVDLSGDFRLRDAGAYERYYDGAHAFPQALGSFAYGLPELHREAIRAAWRVASPGCFATAIALGLIPLARAGLLPPGVLVRTVASTGSSGSGVEAKIGTHHPLRAANLKTYKPLAHQHTPEIEQTLADAGAPDLALDLVPVSAPLVRGIFATSFVDLPDAVGPRQIADAFHAAYDAEPFVRFPAGRLPEVVAVKGTMYVEIGWELGARARGRQRTLVVVSALDNLVKGGGGQAVQCMNLMMGVPETVGLDDRGLWP